MIRLRPTAHSVWLACFMVGCASSDDTNDGMQPLAPTGSDAVPTGSTGPVPDPAATPGPTGSITPTPTVGGMTGVGSTGGGATGGAGPAPTAGNTGGGGPTPQPTNTGGPGDPAPTTTTPTDPTPTGPGGEPTTPPEDPTDPPEPPAPEPSLIVSSNDNFWQVGEVTVADGGNANFTVDTSTTYQEWLGWGGTFNEAGWHALQELSEEDRQRAIRLLFDKADGLDLDWGRIPMGPSDYAVQRYTLSDGPGSFSVEHDRQYLLPFIKAAQAVKDDVIYWGSPWTPPPWAKTGSTENMGYDKGYFNPEYYEEYADFFVSWIQAYEAEGIPIDAVMPQNEPGWAQSYPTCHWGVATESLPTGGVQLQEGEITLGTFVDQHLFRAIDDAGLSTKVWFGTLSNNMYFETYWNDVRTRPSASRLAGVALQWETIVRVPSLTQEGHVVMQSEHRCGNYPWGDSDPNDYITHKEEQPPNDVAPNDFNYGQESWDLFTDWITAGVNIYSAWNMVLDTHGANLDLGRRWHQNSLLVVNRDTNQLIVTPYYYVFRHLTQYVDIGAKRVAINGDALAFKNPDGSVVAVMRTSAPGTQTVSIEGTLLQFEATGNGWVTVNWQGQ